MFVLCLILTPGSALAGPSSEAEVRQSMVDMSRQLGVTCVYCHKMENFKNGDKEAFKIAESHMKIVADLNSRRLRGLPKVDCYMCHQGHAKAPYKEPIDPTKAAAPPAHH